MPADGQITPPVEDEEVDREDKNLASRTARLLGIAIVAGEFDAEKTLPVEAELMRHFNVSRNVIRDAVKLLVGKGLLRTVRRAGTFVEPKQRWNLMDTDLLAWTMSSPVLKRSLINQLTQLRAMLEPEIAALAAQHASITETLRLQEAYDSMERHARDATKAIEADIAFHQRLFEAAHNDLITSLLPALSTLLRANFQISIHSEDGFIRNLEEHRLIAEAVRKQDPAGARHAMQTLLQKNEKDIEATLYLPDDAKTADEGGAGS